jgi:hypothetical protein
VGKIVLYKSSLALIGSALQYKSQKYKHAKQISSRMTMNACRNAPDKHGQRCKLGVQGRLDSKSKFICARGSFKVPSCTKRALECKGRNIMEYEQVICMFEKAQGPKSNI